LYESTNDTTQVTAVTLVVRELTTPPK